MTTSTAVLPTHDDRALEPWVTQFADGIIEVCRTVTKPRTTQADQDAFNRAGVPYELTPKLVDAVARRLRLMGWSVIQFPGQYKLRVMPPLGLQSLFDYLRTGLGESGEIDIPVEYLQAQGLLTDESMLDALNLFIESLRATHLLTAFGEQTKSGGLRHYHLAFQVRS